MYVGYSVFYILGTLLAMQIPFVGFQAIKSSEHLASHGVFIFLQCFYFLNWVKKFIGQEGMKLLTQLTVIGLVVVVAIGYIYLILTVNQFRVELNAKQMFKIKYRVKPNGAAEA